MVLRPSSARHLGEGRSGEIVEIRDCVAASGDGEEMRFSGPRRRWEDSDMGRGQGEERFVVGCCPCGASAGKRICGCGRVRNEAHYEGPEC